MAYTEVLNTVDVYMLTELKCLPGKDWMNYNIYFLYVYSTAYEYTISER